MKIGPLETKPQTAIATERKVPTGTNASTAEPSAQVELRSAAALAGSSDGTFDAEKVQRIAQAIRDGRFKINHEAIADKLIANAQELLGKSSR